MAHCPYAKLSDIKDILAMVRALEHVRENAPGVFYFKRVPFLHFHMRGDRRWADVRDGKDWGAEIDMPFEPSVRAQQVFLREVKRRYQAMI